MVMTGEGEKRNRKDAMRSVMRFHVDFGMRCGRLENPRHEVRIQGGVPQMADGTNGKVATYCIYLTKVDVQKGG